MGFRNTLCVLALTGLGLGCNASDSDSPSGGAGAASGAVEPSAEFRAGVEALRTTYNLASIGVGLVRDRKVLFATAYGFADLTDQKAATGDTIYAMASCSKPVVGLAVARLMELVPTFDLDADVNTYLKWSEPLEHPDYPDTPVTMRHLLRHESGIAANAPFDYDTYPKPDPDTELEAFLRTWLVDTLEYWETFEPGTDEEYSNLATALAGLVVEKVSGRPFNVFCNEELFTPLGMADTRWLYTEFSAEQRDRIALPYDDAGQAYAHYGFNDYPSGLLRTSPRDFTRLLAMLLADGTFDGSSLLAESSVSAFESVPMFIVPGDTDFSHTGGESGVNTAFAYADDGTGYVTMINSDLSDTDLDAVQEALEVLIRDELAR